jgi:hypothetical protein
MVIVGVAEVHEGDLFPHLAQAAAVELDGDAGAGTRKMSSACQDAQGNNN